MAAQQKLQQLFGFSAFRQGQQKVVEQLLQGQSTLAIFPTGAGKSLCYQFVATQLPHLTLVVSPLLALMKDQLEFLHSKGIAAASIDSTLSYEENQQVMQDIRSGVCKILMVSVERFKNERFRQFIQSIPLSMLVVDEAHCISEWGHNFRPDYLKLPAYQQELKIPLVLLLTATATKKVKLDMAKRFAIAQEHIIQTGFYRSNLHLQVQAVEDAAKNKRLVALIRQQTGPGIVYVTLQKTAELVANGLIKQGFAAKAYHAGLDNEVRQKIQLDFMQQKIQIVVATIAFGMGIDKSDIRFVIHYDLPKSIENYSQEIGRAGRDGQDSNCIVLANLDGLTTVENFVFGDTPDNSAIARVIDNIKQSADSAQTTTAYAWEMQIHELSNLSNIRQLPLKTLLVQLELADVLKPLYAYFAEFKLRFIQDKTAILDMFEGERREFLASVFNCTDMKKVWGVVNFDSIYQHYAAPRHRVVTALEYLAEKQLIQLESRLITDVYQVSSSALLTNELVAKLSAYFSDNEQKEIKRIAAMIRFFELDSCLSYNLARYFDDHNAPVQCGRCSVCLGQSAKLSRSRLTPMPDDLAIAEAMSSLALHVGKNAEIELSESIYCRFLTAMTMPLFTRLRVSKLSGFGLCEQQPYAQVRDKVKSILEKQ
ncbi:recombinase RecQ [Paraglaciecola hydrolytica]|uniref:ATP-dependent DNA helicase RecQ n=1 Tax=Paraglaciecola hydrolytica TaxID=1799789 RepID=A0A148KLJ9_9ALTE|nr:recombinase RecQ [Paraglaciecola hydrolytica]